MTTSIRWTSADLESLPENGKRYEIIDGELQVSKQPHLYHQIACGNIHDILNQWNKKTGKGKAVIAPGVIFADDDDVAPDVVWISKERLVASLAADGHLHAAPELVIEVLSPGGANERRDREVKLKLYSRRGVSEYWILDWRTTQVEVFRREDAQLKLVATLYETDTLQTPLLPGFHCQVIDLFEVVPGADIL